MFKKLWGFQFWLFYNTSVLTATGASSYDPFTLGWGPTEQGYFINDTAGYVFLAYSMQFGETVGFATVDAKPIAKIDFTVDAIGKSTLHFANGTEPGTESPVLPTVTAGRINADVHDGFFANVAVEIHDIAVDSVLVSPTIVLAGKIVTIDVTVFNWGTEMEAFDVTVKYDYTEIETKTVMNLAPGVSKSLSFSWDTTDVSLGEHVIKAAAGVVEGEVDTSDNTYVDGIVTVRANLDSIASKYAKNGETYRILNLEVGDNPYAVIIYYPSYVIDLRITDLTGAIVLDGSNLTPLIASKDVTQNFVVNNALTLALAKMRGWTAPDPNYWEDLNKYAKGCYVSLLVMYGGIQALWITIEFAVSGGVSAATIAVKTVEIANFGLSQVDTIAKISGVTQAIDKCSDTLVFIKGVYSGVDALQTVYEAYKVSKVISINHMIEYANKLAYMKTAVYGVGTAVNYVFANDIGGMATAWLEVGEYTKTLEGISKHMSTVLNSIVEGTVTAPEIHSMLASQVLYARLALLMWSALANMYQNIVNKGVFNAWYWLLDAPNSLKHYRGLYQNWLGVLSDNEKGQKDFYDAFDRLFQQSIERVLNEGSSSVNARLPTSINMIILAASIAGVSLQRRKVSMHGLQRRHRRKTKE